MIKQIVLPWWYDADAIASEFGNKSHATESGYQFNVLGGITLTTVQTRWGKGIVIRGYGDCEAQVSEMKSDINRLLELLK